MNAWNEFWSRLSRPARLGLAVGVLLIVLATSWLGWSLLRTEYGVLFSDLADRDMAAMSAELDKQKVPYRVDERARSLLVPRDLVHKLRLQLMGSPVALHGAVGFELFNNSDLAMTDFAQKVNYQRALQGELTRTILSLEAIQSARVHLALPEQGLFRKTTAAPKASVTVQLKRGHVLAPEQVMGIQKLVAASVTDITADHVAVLDQHGVVLSRAAAADDDGMAAGRGLDLKQSTEGYLARKATAVVERIFGAGEALVSVDAELVQDQTRVTTEEVLAARPATADAPATGVVVRERVSTRESGNALQAPDRAVAGTSTQETDYQTGKRVAQVITPAGQVKRLQVAVVVRRAVADTELEKARELVAAAVGLNRARGDVIAVHSMAAAFVVAPMVRDDEAGAPRASTDTPAAATAPASSTTAGTVIPLFALLLAAAAAFALAIAARRRRTPLAPPALDARRRAELLEQVESWLGEDSAATRPAALRGR